MTNTPMTFEEWFMLQSKMVYRHPQEIAEIAWQASQAQQAQTIAELVEALVFMEAHTVLYAEHQKRIIARELITKAKGTTP